MCYTAPAACCETERRTIPGPGLGLVPGKEGVALKWFRPVTESWPGRFVSSCLRRYFHHDVGRQSAALAYYLLFTLFPFLIFLSSLLGLLQLDVSEVVGALQPLLPAEVLDVAEAYLEYASRTSSAAML